MQISIYLKIPQQSPIAPLAPFTRDQFSKGPLLNRSMVVKFYKM